MLKSKLAIFYAPQKSFRRTRVGKECLQKLAVQIMLNTMGKMYSF